MYKNTFNCATGEVVVEPLSDEEVASIVPVDPKDAIRAQIKQLESEQMIPRAMREFSLGIMEKEAIAYAASISTQEFPVTAVEVLALNPGYQAVKAFDNQIAALRSQL